jgi:DNA-binding transcriptional LysR family regulator
LFESFHTRFPGLQIELLLSDRYVDLSKREADIAIRSIGRELKDETLVGRKIAEGPWAVYASHSYIERHGRPERPEDIDHHCVVKCDGIIAEHSAGQWLRAHAPHATVTACSESWPALVLAVKSGVGLAPLSTALGDGERELVRVIDVPELVTRFYLLMHPDMRRVPRVRAFFDFVVSEIKAFRTVLAGEAGKQGRQEDLLKTDASLHKEQEAAG